MLEWGVIEKRPSPWGSPVTAVVAKKNGSQRISVDYRHTLNHYTVRESRPLPDIGT